VEADGTDLHNQIREFDGVTIHCILTDGSIFEFYSVNCHERKVLGGVGCVEEGITWHEDGVVGNSSYLGDGSRVSCAAQNFGRGFVGRIGPGVHQWHCGVWIRVRKTSPHRRARLRNGLRAKKVNELLGRKPTFEA
jgi:hypothetical protein